MRPEELTVRNFGPFAGEARIPFRGLDDIFLITGKTGSGKTSIFDALCFALYGTVPGSRRGHISHLRSDYTEADQECFVSLDFSAGEKRYRVDRSPRQEKRKKRGTGTTPVEESAELYQMSGSAWMNLSVKKSETDRRIRELIGLEAEEFFKIVLLPQGEFAEFLRQNTTDRREVLGKLFPVDKAVQLRELAQEKAREGLMALREAERALGEITKRITPDTYGERRSREETALGQAKARLAAVAEESVRLRELRALGQREAETLGQLEKAREHRTAGEELFLAAEAHFAELASLEPALAALREQRPGLKAMIEEEEILRRNTEEAEKLHRRLAGLAEKNEGLRKKNLEQEAELRELRVVSRDTETLEARWEQDRQILDSLVGVKKLAAKAETLEAEKRNLKRDIGDLEKLRLTLQQDIPVLTAELVQLKYDREVREKADMAAHLGADLKPGEPCPVCGSREHPLPAAAPPGIFGIEERIESLDRAVKEAEQNLAARRAELDSRQEELRRLERESRKLVQELEEIKAPCPSPEDPELAAFLKGQNAPFPPETAAASRLLEVQIKRLNRITTRRSEAQRALKRLTVLYREQSEILAEAAETEKEYAGLSEKYTHLKAGILELKEKQNRTLAAHPGAGAAEALAVLDRRIAETGDRIRKYREERESAGREFAAASAREEAAQKAYDEAAARYRKNAAGDGTAEGGGAGPGQEELEARLAALTHEQEAAENERDRANGALITLERDAALLRETQDRFRELTEQNRLINTLAEDLTGKNPKKKSFDAWLLGLYLAEVALFATRRLERMSEGRYSLLLDSAGEGGRGRTGLDLAVFDAYTGKTRPCATLSGGESFMASISLALGLADSIQNRSGGVRLDAVFIDEGFGSLDEGSLDKALVILDELRDRRMVGLISHVGELRSRIPSRIEVIKSGSGSTIGIEKGI